MTVTMTQWKFENATNQSAVYNQPTDWTELVLIPHICLFWYTTILFISVKSTPTKCVNLKQFFLEKSTPPPVVRWWTNIRYGHTGLKKIPRHCRSDSRFPKTQLTHVWMKILNFSHFSWAIFKKSCFFSCPSFAYFHSAKPLFSKFMVFLWVFMKIKITLYSIGQRWEEGFLQIFGFSIFAPFLAIFGLFWIFLCFQWRFGVFESASESR